jgi:HEPN domain-containing protein
MDDKQITVVRWLKKAAGDLLTAKTMVDMEAAPTDVVCFHCQQSAEKYLKAFLVNVDQDFPKTHDLQRLLALCQAHEPEFGSMEPAAVALTDYAVETRYPDDWREIPMTEAHEAIVLADQIKAFVEARPEVSAILPRE